MLSEQSITQLARLPFFLDLSDDTVQRVLRAFNQAGQAEAVPDGTVLLQEGEKSSDTGFILLDGEVSVSASCGFSKEVHGPVLLGEMKQFDFERTEMRLATVVANAGVRVIRFSWMQFYEALSDRLSPEELKEFSQALENYAWLHYLERQEEI